MGCLKGRSDTFTHPFYLRGRFVFSLIRGLFSGDSSLLRLVLSTASASSIWPRSYLRRERKGVTLIRATTFQIQSNSIFPIRRIPQRSSRFDAPSTSSTAQHQFHPSTGEDASVGGSDVCYSQEFPNDLQMRSRVLQCIVYRNSFGF